MVKKAKTLRVGVVGLGMGKHHVKAFQACTGCEVVAVCDTDARRLKAYAGEQKIDKTFADAQAMFDAGLADAVSIATPNFTHHPLTMAALEAGLHVLCEKPMALNAKQAQEMADTAVKRKRKLAIHFNHRMTPVARTIARYAQDGRLGEIYFARTVWHRRRGIPRGASGWFLQRKTAGGGCLIDLGVHILDGVLFPLGYPKITSVSGQTYNRFGKVDVPDGKMDVDDFVVAQLRCESGAVINVEVSWASHHEHPEQMILALYGTEGGIVRRTENYQDAPLEIHHRDGANLATTRLLTLDSGASVQQDFVDAIAKDREPVCSAAHGLATMQIIDAIYESSRTGRQVELA